MPLVSKPENMCTEKYRVIRDRGMSRGKPDSFRLQGNHSAHFLGNVTKYQCYSLTDLVTLPEVKNKEVRRQRLAI